MNIKRLRVIFCTVAALVIAAVAFGGPVTPDQALESARTVVLVKRVVHDKQILSYLKEVWRVESGVEKLPELGSIYGNPIPYDPRMPFSVRDAIVFEFGKERPKGFPYRWSTTVTEKGLVPVFQKTTFERRPFRSATDVDTISGAVNEAMTLDEVRTAVKTTKPPKPSSPQSQPSGASSQH